MKSKSICAVCSVLAMAVCSAASLAPTTAYTASITFAGPADYDNSAAQTTGTFRDVLNGSVINQGNDLGSTGHTALNFTGSDNNAATAGRNTLYDTNVTDGLPTLFSGNISMSADILTHQFNNSKGAGLEFLFNEGTGKQGMSLSLWNAGNTDLNTLQLVTQTGETRPVASLSTVSLGSGIAQDNWYRLLVDLTFTDATHFTVTGQVFSHTTGTDPNSALGAQVGTTLTYSDVLSTTLLNPYEIGLVARGDSAVVDTSVTNFSFQSAAPVPGPIAGAGLPGLISACFGMFGLNFWRRRRQNAA